MALGDNELQVVKFAQGLLQDDRDGSSITPEVIGTAVDRVVGLNPRWGVGLDRLAVTDELIRRFSVWIGADTALSSEVGHVPWLNAARKQEWRYWQRYREWLEKKLSWRAIEGLDRSSDTVLGFLEDPRRPGPWDRRGLVVGHVQSGKTGNYTGLICKAADAGYKIIIVLAGLHNNLRSQTQMRLDEGFLGYETSPNRDDSSHTTIGVGKIDSDISIRPNYVTNRADNGDFNAAVSKNLGISPEQRPWLFVVKKNGGVRAGPGGATNYSGVLGQLFRWLTDHVADAHRDSPVREDRRVTRLPLLIIDDEADNASVDTGERVVDENGQPDPDHQPTSINKLIRRILHLFDRAAYVGYTATPFANIFIHERGETRAEGADLFPAAFIVNLAAPSNYIGPSKVFGVRDTTGRLLGLPLVVQLDRKHEEWMPPKHKKGHIPMWQGQAALPPSLAEAVDAFLLVCAARRARGQAAEHCSMLVHVTRFSGSDGGSASVQQHVHDQIEDHVRRVRQRIGRGIDEAEVLDRLRGLWAREFEVKDATIRSAHPDLCGRPVGWDEIVAALPDALDDVKLRRINGTAKDALDYVEHEGTGLKVIAIGGDKLSRGLTLEGLTVSYFLRASKMYDTLMQMGRWFGYRPGYLDLCRLYTTPDLVLWFSHITDAADELREEFDLMAASGATPREYGLKVQSHSELLVTSPMKMRTAREQHVSFSGSLLETVALRRDVEAVQANLETTRRLVRNLGPSAPLQRPRPEGRQDSWVGHLWEGVPAAEVSDFLSSFRTHPQALKVNGPMIADFIRQMAAIGELTSWTVAAVGAPEDEKRRVADIGVPLPMIKRAAESEDEGRYSIGRLLSPRDEAIDLDAAAWQEALVLTRRAWTQDASKRRAATAPDLPSGPAIRRVRGFGGDAVPAHPERGLLLLYALDPKKAYEPGDARTLPFDIPVIAFGVSFPGSDSGTKVVYKVNNVLWEQEYGASE
jgi:hypothetical protein